MSLEAWLLFVLTEGALCLTPGPAVLLVSATGLGALLLASYALFSAIRWIGAGCLVWLGVTALLGRSSALTVSPAAAPVSGWRTFVDGFVLQIANPKALVFFTALLPPFIDPRRSVVTQVAILGVTSVVLEFFVLLAYGALAGRLTGVATRPRFQTMAKRTAGAMLVTAGVSVALQKT